MTPEKVIAPSTPFENLVDSVVGKLKEMPGLSRVFTENPTAAIAGVSFAILLILFVVFKKSKQSHHQETLKNNKKPVQKSSKKE